ncbi:MAG: S41 family peptidase, partial [Candidatus Heimdallarchaeaceae archaeon]
EAVSQSFERSYLYVDPYRKKLYVKILTPQLFGKGAIFTVENYTNSAIVNVTFSTIPKLWFYSLPQNNHVTKLSDDCGYIYLSSFNDVYVDSDKSMLFSFYEQIENCSKLIIDIRDNTGGSTRYWYENILQPLAKSTLTYDYYLAFRTGDYVSYFRKNRSLTLNVLKEEVPVTLPPEVYTDDFSDLYYAQEQIEPSLTTHFNFNGQIYLLVSDNVYSAAETFAYICKQTHFATLYGTYTGGDGIGIDPIVFVLPNSKLVIRMSQTMGIKADGNADEESFISPNYFFESTYGNYDELINYVLAQ